MSCQFHRTCFPAQVDEEQWFRDNGCCTNAARIYSPLCIRWALNYTISTGFPYLGGGGGGGGAILLTVKSDVVCQILRASTSCFDSGFIYIPSGVKSGFPVWNLTITDDSTRK
jgi:hypothetical protein